MCAYYPRVEFVETESRQMVSHLRYLTHYLVHRYHSIKNKFLKLKYKENTCHIRQPSYFPANEVKIYVNILSIYMHMCIYTRIYICVKFLNYVFIFKIMKYCRIINSKYFKSSSLPPTNHIKSLTISYILYTEG